MYINNNLKMNIKKLLLSIKKLLKAKWTIFPPKKVDIVLFDEILILFKIFK